jgi:hypothetical protein
VVVGGGAHGEKRRECGSEAKLPNARWGEGGCGERGLGEEGRGGRDGDGEEPKKGRRKRVETRGDGVLLLRCEESAERTTTTRGRRVLSP